MYYQTLAMELLNLRSGKKQVSYERQMSKLMKGETFVLVYLTNHENEIHPKTISDEFMMSTARTSVILKNLEKDGYICRIPDSNDNRQTIIKISEKGKERCEKFKKEMLQFIADVLEQLGPDDATEYVRLNRRVLDIVFKT
ncbi:MAG: transcriptional regulator [Ruminococcus sp.]|nr:transcriptional regulator [Ruminococcus sp.]